MKRRGSPNLEHQPLGLGSACMDPHHQETRFSADLHQYDCFINP
jgi:hypothetical protein